MTNAILETMERNTIRIMAPRINIVAAIPDDAMAITILCSGVQDSL